MFKRKAWSKYRNTKIKFDGITFDSKKESERYQELKLMKMSKQIKDFECQPKFKFPMPRCSYIADFRVIYNDGTEIIEDVKSEFTKRNPVYRLKKKMLNYFYPEVNFREVIN